MVCVRWVSDSKQIRNLAKQKPQENSNTMR